jgi:hypothetical protein
MMTATDIPDTPESHATAPDVTEPIDDVTEPIDDVTEPINDTPLRWFIRGTALGMLVMGSVNAVSYFFRSSSWGSLVGRPTAWKESIGFPFKVWEAGNTYGGLFADYWMLALNVLAAAALGSLLGIWSARHTTDLNRWVEGLMPSAEPHDERPVQFSLRGLMIATGIAAVVATVARNFAARPETLIAIYALGPASLVAIAMLPRKLSWQKRVMIIVPAAYAMIAAAIAVGIGLGMDFDKVLMGIFLCWTPQSALAAVGLTTAIFVSQAYRESKIAPPA